MSLVKHFPRVAIICQSSYLLLQRAAATTQLHSKNTTRLVVPIENGTFEDSAASLFNRKDVKTCSDYYILVVNYINS